MAKKTVTVTDNASGKTAELEVQEGTHGPGCISIGSLYKETGYFTYDPGYGSTGSCKSGITFIDGDEGVLLIWKSATCFSTASYPKSRISKRSVPQ